MSAATRIAGVIGDPVRHSLSPAIHNAAFEAAGLDWVYVAFPVPRGRGRHAVAAMRDLGIDGLNVTMPHKADAAAGCDRLSERARRLGSVNTVAHADDGSLAGDSTDGEGLLAALREEGVPVDGRRVLVLGAGGAARAVALALSAAGASAVVSARRPEAAAEVVSLLGAGEALAWEHRDAGATEADIVLNATPIGMSGMSDAEGTSGHQTTPVDPGALRSEQVVVDLVYRPVATPLLIAARRAGATAVDGTGMLIHQAALAFEQWTGVRAPLPAMRAAVASVLGE